VRIVSKTETLRTVQKLAHRRQNEELVAAHSASASEASSPGASSPKMKTPTGDSTAVATPTQNTAIPVLVQLDSEDSATGQDGVLDHTTGEATGSGAELGQRPARGNSDKKGSGVQTISLTNAGPSEVSLSSPTESRQRSDDKKSSHDEGTGTGRDGGAGGDGKPEVEEGQYLKSKLWWLGLSLIAVGEGGNFLSYGFAPASVVAPLGTVVGPPSLVLSKWTTADSEIGPHSQLHLRARHPQRALPRQRALRHGSRHSRCCGSRLVVQSFKP
jgi:hypothetical protein